MNDLRCILCPVDFSEATPFGINVGESLARQYDVPLMLAHVVPRVPMPLRLPLDPGLAEGWRAHARERLERLAAASRCRGVPTATELASGVPVQQIAKLASAEGAGAVVLPTHGRASRNRLFHGSVAEAVVRAVAAPVLTVPPSEAGLEPFAPRRVLLATDFSAAADTAFETALELAQRYASELIIAHVFAFEQIGEHGSEWFRPTFTKDQVEAAIRQVTRRLERLAAAAQKLGLQVSTDISQAASPAREITRMAEDEDVDLVIVGSHGEGVLKHVLLGSTTTKLVRFCSRPLLTVRVGDSDPAGAQLPALVTA